MSFRIKSSHKFTEMYSKEKQDYKLFDVKPVPNKPRKGGNHIHSTNLAQADFY